MSQTAKKERMYLICSAVLDFFVYCFVCGAGGNFLSFSCVERFLSFSGKITESLKKAS